MRVLHVAESTAGGLGVYLDAVTSGGVERGYEVHVAVPAADDARSRFEAMGVRFHSWEVGPRPDLRLPAEWRRMRQIMTAADPDVVHLHSSKAGLVGRTAIRGSRATIFQPHSWSFGAVDGLWASGALRWERLAVRWTDLVLCVSKAERAAADVARLGAPLEVVPNGVDLDRFAFADLDDRRAARGLLGLGDEPLAICVGRLHRQKNQAALLDAWPAVRSAVPNARLVLLGSGPDADQLAKRGVDGVLLAGQVDDVRDWYVAADLVVQPSRWEGMSLAVLEALATGRSVVATQVSGMAEVLEPSALVAPDDTAALVAAIVRRFSDTEFAAGEGTRGRRRVEAEHDVRTHVQKVLELEATIAARRDR